MASIPPQGGRKHPQQEYLQVDTSNILFICGGAFADLPKIIQQRTDTSSIGFGAKVKDKDAPTVTTELMRQVEPEDLMKFGLIPEFVGRLPVMAVLDELNEAALIQILTEPKNALTKQYQKLFALEGVELNFRDPALEAIARQAIKRKSGARGLRSIVEQKLLDVMYELPALTGLQKVVVDENVINQDAKPLYIYDQNNSLKLVGED